jgi:hypothetical protein
LFDSVETDARNLDVAFLATRAHSGGGRKNKNAQEFALQGHRSAQ